MDPSKWDLSSAVTNFLLAIISAVAAVVGIINRYMAKRFANMEIKFTEIDSRLLHIEESRITKLSEDAVLLQLRVTTLEAYNADKMRRLASIETEIRSMGEKIDKLPALIVRLVKG